MNPEQQIEKLHEALTLLNRDNATQEEVIQLFGVLADAIRAIKTDLEEKIDSTRTDSNNSYQETLSSLEDLEGRVNDIIENVAPKTSLESFKKELSAEIQAVRDAIPDLPDFQGMLEDLEKKIPQIPDFPEPIEPDDGEQIVEKINDLPTDDDKFKIDAKHIKNLPKQKAMENIVYGGGGIKGIEAGDNIIVEDSPTYAGFKKITLVPKITVSATAPADPALNDLWVDIS